MPQPSVAGLQPSGSVENDSVNLASQQPAEAQEAAATAQPSQPADVQAVAAATSSQPEESKEEAKSVEAA